MAVLGKTEGVYAVVPAETRRSALYRFLALTY